MGNAASYGISAQLDRRELNAGQTEVVTVHGFGDAFETKTATPEDPGAYFFSPVAALVADAARLMLALPEAAVTASGGTYAFCDTDSMGIFATRRGGLIPCPGGPYRMRDGREAIRALSWAEVEAIRALFAALNPYDATKVPGSILKIEPENFSGAKQRRIWCFAISAKRYALFARRGGHIQILKASEHGLGHLLNPTDVASEDRRWIHQLWEFLIREAFGLSVTEPAWLDRPAMSRVTITTPTLLRAFAAYNNGKSFPEQIKPYNFGLSAQVAAFGHPDGADTQRFHLIAPFESDPACWGRLPWFDLYSGQLFRITTRGESGGDAVARVKTYRNVVDEYRVHPEAKSLGPDGAPCGRATVGLLARRHVVAEGLPKLIGKEANKLEDVEAGLVHAEDEVLNVYAPRLCGCGECGQLVQSGRARYVSNAHRQLRYRRRRVS